jgi:hypothetical protein
LSLLSFEWLWMVPFCNNPAMDVTEYLVGVFNPEFWRV